MTESEKLIKEIKKALEKEPSLKLDIVEIVSKIEPVTYEEANKVIETLEAKSQCFWRNVNEKSIRKKAMNLNDFLCEEIGKVYVKDSANAEENILALLNDFCSKVQNKDFSRMNVYLKLEQKCSVIDIFDLREEILDRRLPKR